MKRRRPTPQQKHKSRMKRYRKQTLRVARRNPHEKWMKEILENTGLRWLPQHIFGNRIFDFFCPQLGVAVEVDGDDHSPDWDHYRDADNWWSRRVIVLRVRNHNGEDADRMLKDLPAIGQWYPRYRSALPTEIAPQSGFPLETIATPRPAPKRRSKRRIRGHRA